MNRAIFFYPFQIDDLVIVMNAPSQFQLGRVIDQVACGLGIWNANIRRTAIIPFGDTLQFTLHRQPLAAWDGHSDCWWYMTQPLIQINAQTIIDGRYNIWYPTLNTSDAMDAINWAMALLPTVPKLTLELDDSHE